MNSIRSLKLPLVLALSLSGVACGASAAMSTPQALADHLSRSFEQADFEALDRSFALRGAPALARAMLHDMALDCSGRLRCAVSVVPLNEEWRERAAQMRAEEGVVAVDEVLGLLKLDGKSRSPQEGMSESLKLEVPYARVDGQYQVAGMRYTEEKLAELRSQTAWQVAEAHLACCVYDFSTREQDPDFLKRASKLPADGGAAGAELLARTEATAQALAARDPDAYAALEPEVGMLLYGPTDWEGNAVPLALRQRKIQTAGLTELVEVTVLGGWQLDDQALLVVEGRNGAGSEIRGVQRMSFREERWRPLSRDFNEIPSEQ